MAQKPTIQKKTEYTMKLEKHSVNIWVMAFGYFLFYIPYSALVKALSEGILPGMSGPVSGFHLLPTVLVGSFITFQLILFFTGWWKHAATVQLGRLRIPFASSRHTFFSGIATAVIIATTTLAYTFSGISIVFSLLLMRGGVLILAPIIDKFFNRKVNWYSWVALAMSFLALSIALADQKGYALSAVVAINIGAYLTGYFFRLRFMTLHAKSKDRNQTYRYFSEEMIVASVALLVAPILLAASGMHESFLLLREGYLTMFSSSFVGTELLIGFLYAGLYIFGTRIYLDQRENTFCIPINRCSSLLSGVIASFALTFFLGKNMVNNTQLLSAGIIILTLLVLSFPILNDWRRLKRTLSLQQLYIFVCEGNTSRSPIAQAICSAEIKKMLGLENMESPDFPVRVISAGLAAKPGTPLHPFAATVLTEMAVNVPHHRSQNLRLNQVENASIIWCMSELQKMDILKKFPSAAHKVKVLNPDQEIENPSGKPIEVMRQVAQQIRDSIVQQLGKEVRLQRPVIPAT